MKNFVQDGSVLSLAAPYARSSGQGALIGSIFGVATTDVANAATCQFATSGVFDVEKTSSQAWTPGQLVYWDDTSKVATTVSTSNKLVGVAVAAAANPSSTGRVRLNGAFIS